MIGIEFAYIFTISHENNDPFSCRQRRILAIFHGVDDIQDIYDSSSKCEFSRKQMKEERKLNNISENFRDSDWEIDRSVLFSIS